jgi:protein involved in polysaccharide export with SLBB domain
MNSKNYWTACLLWCALVCGGCAASSAATSDASGARPPAGQHLSPDCLAAGGAEDSATYRIRPGDKLNISFYLNSEFDTAVVVRPDGKIELKLIGEVAAAGSTPTQLEDNLDRLYSKELLNPGATVRLEDAPGRVVYVEGQVGHPGPVPLAPGMTATQAITASGGLTDSAGPDNVVLVRRDACGEAHDEPLNLNKALKRQGHEDDVVLAPTDMLIVPRSGIAQAGLFVKQYIKDMLPINPYISAPMF